jgi:hypothetical protein
MTISLEGLEQVCRRKTFGDIAVGTSFAGAFMGEFGVWHKTGQLEVVRLNERGWMHVIHLSTKQLEQYASVFHYTKVNLSVQVASVDEHPGGR